MDKSLAERVGYTPGPWSLPHFADGERDAKCPCGYVFGKDDPGCRTVGEVFYHDKNDGYDEHYPIEMAKANARVIATAIQTLEALESLMKGVDGLPPLTAIEGVLSDQWEESIKAIESATGLSWEELSP